MSKDNRSLSFTFESLEQQYLHALNHGYHFMTCADYVRRKSEGNLPGRIVVNRIDVDVCVRRAERLGELYDRLGIKGTFFIRLHAKDYNAVSFENYRVIKMLAERGHEIGHHSEVIDAAAIWNESPESCFRRDIELMKCMFNVEVYGSAGHGGMTGLNNLDFWDNRQPQEFGLLYEGYDTQPQFNLFQEALYISDSEWIRWKCYQNGEQVKGDYRTFGEHIDDAPPLIYLLTHPETYYDLHPYE
jgi:hypothetical protein